MTPGGASAATIVQLYPEELGVAGDRGNVMALTSRLEHAGISAELVQHRRGDSFAADADIVLVGSGPLSAMRNIYDDLFGNRDILTSLVASGVPLFAFGSGAELFSNGIDLIDGQTLDGLGILPFRAVRTTARRVGYIVTETADGQLVGFEDHASEWRLDAGASRFGELTAGGGNGNGTDEGVVIGPAIGTQIGGPVLPLNPNLTDAILGKATARAGLVYAPGEAHTVLDEYARKAREVITRNVSYKFHTI